MHDPANDVRAFVYRWFDGFDRQKPETFFLASLPAHHLDMRYPDTEIRTREDFHRWYANVQATIANNTHEVSDLEVVPLGQGRYAVSLNVLWRAKTREGESISLHVHQEWEIRREGEAFILERLNATVSERD